MTNNEFIPSDEHLWHNVLRKTTDQEQIDQRGRGDTRIEDPYLLERLHVSGSAKNPGLDLDPDSGVLKIEVSNESHCTLHSFGPVLFWMRHYCTRPQAKTILELNCGIKDPFSCVYIKRVMHLLESVQSKGLHAEVHYTSIGKSPSDKQYDNKLSRLTNLPVRHINRKP